MRELLGDGERVVADGQHVPLDGRLRLGLERRQPLGCRGVDLDQRLLVLAQHSQPPDQALAHLPHRLPVHLGGRQQRKSWQVRIHPSPKINSATLFSQ